MKENKQYSCPIEATLDIIGGKYKALILWHLANKTVRYNEIRKALPKGTAKVITEQLRQLEEDGLITRTVYPEVPPKVEYALTEFGYSVIPILDTMCDWGRTYIQNNNLGDL